MARSPVSNLGELLRRDPTMSGLGLPRPRSPKPDKKLGLVSAKNEDWQAISSAVTALFQRKKLENFELEALTVKVKTVKLELGINQICNNYKESILMKGMIILREDVKEKSGELLLEKLAEVWVYFFGYILPMLQAVFLHLTPPDGLTIRDISLLSFRDIIVLKTKLEEAFCMDLAVPPRVTQMLLVLQSVHDSNPSSINYRKLETLISYVVSPYLSSTGLRCKPLPRYEDVATETKKNQSELSKPAKSVQRPVSTLIGSRVTDRLDPVLEVDHGRRHTLGTICIPNGKQVSLLKSVNSTNYVDQHNSTNI